MKTIWIARDATGDIYWYTEKPIRRKFTFARYRGFFGSFSSEMFPEITFESGPVEVELTIKEVQS